MRIRTLTIVATAVAATGCYHVTVVTGRPESSTVIDRPWQLSLVSGLVPPPEIQADDRCTNGVAKVETKRSFLNSLAGSLSGGLITPMATRVTCAAASPSPDAVQDAAAAPAVSIPAPVGDPSGRDDTRPEGAGAR